MNKTITVLMQCGSERSIPLASIKEYVPLPDGTDIVLRDRSVVQAVNRMDHTSKLGVDVRPLHKLLADSGMIFVPGAVSGMVRT